MKELDKAIEKKPIKVDPSEPSTIPKFVDELPIMPKAKPANPYEGKNYYEIVMKEGRHCFHKAFPPTKIWGYDGIYPGPTIEALRDRPIHVRWINDLPFKHFLPVDKTLHGSIGTPEVRTVVHLHGANVAPDSDGSPDAWYTRNYAFIGKAFKNKVYEYTNHQPSTTLWYHDHSLGTTRLNVYAGLTGLYLLRDFNEMSLGLPEGDYEIPLLVQDRTFNKDGSLFYPEGPNTPVSVSPSVVPAFFGNTIAVNGKLWPYLEVEPRKYRFRIVNGSNTRGYIFALENGEGFTQLGTDGGLLHHSVSIDSFELEPAERIDLVVDFSKYKGEKFKLMNMDEPEDEDLGVIMEFRVTKRLKEEDKSKVPEMLYPEEHLDEAMAERERLLPLSASRDHFGRPMLMLDGRMWNDPVTETPMLDSIEIWKFINTTPFPHPIHVHLVQFRILSRQAYDVERYLNDEGLFLIGDPIPPRAFEGGWKDTVKSEPGMVTSVIMQFKDHIGDYVWHCHILEHEDHDMMRPIRVVDIGIKERI